MKKREKEKKSCINTNRENKLKNFDIKNETKRRTKDKNEK